MTRVAADAPFVSRLIADEAANLCSQEDCHSLRGCAGCQSPRLEHHDSTIEPRLFDQPQWCHRRLAGARWRYQQCGSVVLERVAQLGQHIDNRKVASRGRQRHVSAECWCAVKRSRVTGNWDGRADPCRCRSDLLGDLTPLFGVPTFGAGLQRAVQADEDEGR